ncbi:MAG TPA: Ig-like domain repeat protein [Bryobacteraceae bacterium]|nr:Ig-like domain repeat protein [Bryobacteraceae bacterium]
MRQFCLLGLGAAFALSVLAGHGSAQCSTTGGAIRYSSASGLTLSANTIEASSSITVPPGGAVASICVELKGVTSSGQGSQSMRNAAFLLTSPGSTNSLILLSGTGDGIDGDDAGDPGSGLVGVNISVSDGASINAPCGISCNGQTSPAAWPHTGAISVRPSSYWMATHGGAGPPLGIAGNWPQSDGSATFSSAINGAAATGDWTLTLADSNGDPISVSSWSIVIATVASADTTTGLGSSLNPSFTSVPGNLVTLTATVTAGSGGPPSGTVSFTENGIAFSGCGAVALAGSGATAIAQCIVTFATEGNHSLQASYNPNGGNAPSASPILHQFVKNHSSFAAGQYCNAGAISFAAGSSATPYPSIINVGSDTAALTSAIETVAVTLNGLTSSSGLQGVDFLLVGPDGVHNLEFLSGSGAARGVQPTATITLTDTSGTPAPSGFAFLNGAIYEPTDRNLNAPGEDVFNPPETPAAPSVPVSIHHAPPDGSATLASAFQGINGNGDWSLFVNSSGQAMSVSGGWCLDFTLATGNATISSVTSSRNPALLGDVVLVTASVQSGGNAVTTGSVTFTDGDSGAAPAGLSGSNTVALDSDGRAIIATSALPEGDHKIIATYNGTGAFNQPSASLYQRVDNITTIQPPNGNQARFCNTGAITLPFGIGAASPNPSNILVDSLPGSVATVSVQLENFSSPQSSALAALLVGPLGTNLNFFSGTGDATTTLAAGLYSFTDNAALVAPESQFGPGSYQPTDYDPRDAFTQSPSNFEMLPSPPYNQAGPAGVATLSTIFASPNGNAVWSLYFHQSIETQSAASAANGWCLTFAVNPPELAASESPSGMQLVQGSSAAVRVDVHNPVGPGAAGGALPVTVTDTFPSGLIPTGGSGAGWTCAAPAGQIIQCTSSEFVPPGSDFDSLTLSFQVANNAVPGTVSNTAVVSGSGLAGGVNSNAPGITILQAAVLSVGTSAAGTFVAGQTAEWDVSVSNSASANSTTAGTTTIVDTLPAGYTLSSFSSIPISPAWTCGAIANVVTCTSTQAVGNGTSFSKLQLFVNVPANSASSVTNTVVAFGGGDVIHTSAGNGAVASGVAGNVAAGAASPTIAISFGSSAAGVGGTVRLTIQIQNPNASVALTGIAFADNFPAGLVVASQPAVSNGCGGVLGLLPGSPSILLTSATLAANAVCTISFTLSATAAGSMNNITGPVSANESGPGLASNTASLLVIQPPTVSASFGAPSIPLNGSTTLTFHFTNPSEAGAFVNLALTNPLPPGLAIANPADAVGTCLTNGGARLVANPGATSVVIRSLSLAPAATCSASIHVAASSAGAKNDTSSNLTADIDDGSGNLVSVKGGAASANMNVVAPPSIGAVFSSPLIVAGDSTTLTFTITNPAANAVPLSGVGFVDSLPAGITVSNSTFSACDGGAVTTDPGAGIIFTGGVIGVNSSCRFSVTVTGATVGSYLDTTGAVTSANGGSGNTAPAVLSVEVATPAVSNSLAINPVTVNFAYSLGGAAVSQSQTVTVTASSPFTITADIAPGAPWLSAIVSGTDVTVTANAAGLAAGDYHGSLLLSISLASAPVSLPVTLTVLGAPALTVSSASLAFTASQSSTGASPQTQSILLSAQNGNISFTASASDPWLSVTNDASQTPATLQVTVSPGTMLVGVYSGIIQITAKGASNSPFTIPVTLRIVTPTVTSSGIFENSASFLTGPGAANTIMAVYGDFSCSAKPVVLVNNVAVEIIGATASQVTFTLPPGVNGETSIDVAVDCNGREAASALLPLSAVSPGIFTLAMNGSGQAAAVNQNGVVNGGAHPAARNSYLSLYGTGFGSYLAPSADGLVRLSGTVEALVGGKPAAVQFAGHAPGSTLGLQQMNIFIPSDAPTGAAVPVELRVNGTSTQAGVTVAIEK